MQKIAISILNYNSQADTIKCLNSIREINNKGFELLTYVLDNGSKEEIEIDESKFEDINIRVIKLKINTGFTGGHNIIYKKALAEGFDYFLILNNDCILDKESLQYLVQSIDGEKYAASVPKIYFTKGREYHKERYKEKDLGRVIWYAGGRIDWDNVVSVHIGLDEVDSQQFDKKSEITFATGACLLIKKDVLLKTGLFDEKYFLYYEDADLSVRIRKEGYRLVYEPGAIVWHSNAASSGSGSALHDYYLTRNKLIFGMKHAPLIVRIHLLREAFRIFLKGREWQKKGVTDFFIGKFGKGSYGS